MKYICSKCGITEEVTTRKAKCDCGSLWKLDYKIPKFDLSLVDKDTWGLFRYRAFIPLEGEHWREISLGEGMTPVNQLDEDVLLLSWTTESTPIALQWAINTAAPLSLKDRVGIK